VVLQLFFMVGIERVMQLRIWHRTTVKPYIYQVGFAGHGIATIAYQHYLVYIRLVEVFGYFLCILVDVQYLISFIYLFFQFGYATYTLYLAAIFTYPYR